MNDIIYTLEYKDFVNSIIQKIQNAQYESLKLVNKNLIQLYWDIGKEICERQKRYGWGKSIVEDLALELRETFSGRTGFSARNLWRMRNFFVTFEENGDVPPIVAEINWTKMIVDYVCEAIIDKEKPQHKIVVYGEPGTGKSLLTNTIVYNLVNEKGVCAENIAVILPNKTLPKLFRGLYKKLNLNVTVATAAGIINSSKRYDTVVVDEGQRLRKYFSKDGWMFKHLDKDNVENNELQQLKKITNNLVIFYDKYQRIRPSDIDIRTFEKGCKEFYKLKLEQQFRIRGQFKVADGKDYISALKNILQIEAVSYNPTVFKEYDFNIVHSMKALERWVKDKQSIPGAERSRILSGYAFEWISKKDSGKYDFIEGDFKRRWNKNSEKWTEQKNSKDEVGCTHAVLSVDLNYVGVIIGDDIDISEDGKLIPNRDSFYDINGKTIKNEDPDDSQLLEYIKNNYYILLSRGMDGCRVYFTNKKLEAYFKSKMKA